MTVGDSADSVANGLTVNITPPSPRFYGRAVEAQPKKPLCHHRKNFEAHGVEVAERPGRGRGQPGDGAGIDQPGPTALDVRHLLDAGDVRMAAAHQVPLAGAGHGMAVLRVV